jgi:ribonuclease P protein component
MLKKTNRIQNQRLIQKLGKDGQSYKSTHFVFKFLPSDLPDSKFAISISKKVAPQAVRRNKLRRQVAESLRHSISEIKKAIVCLIIQKKGTPDKLDYSIIEKEIQEFINHLK